MRHQAEVIQFQKKQEAKFMCSACGEDRGCNCNAPAVEKIAAEKERQRQKARNWREKKKQNQQSRTGTENNDDAQSDADHEEGLRVIAVRGLLNRANEARELATLGKLQSADVTEAMIQAAESAATAWSAMARNLRRMIDE